MLSNAEFKVFRKEVEMALVNIAKKYDVDVHTGGISYTANSFSLKLNMNKKEINGKSFEQAEFEKNCILFDFKPDDYNKEFSTIHGTYNLIGFNLKSHKYGALARSKDGKNYKFIAESVKRLIGGVAL